MAEVTDIEKQIAQAIRTYFDSDMVAKTVARAALAAMLESVGEPVAWRYSKRNYGGNVTRVKDDYAVENGWTETPLYSLAALEQD